MRLQTTICKNEASGWKGFVVDSLVDHCTVSIKFTHSFLAELTNGIGETSIGAASIKGKHK